MADLHVSKKTIKVLFSEMQGKKFIIPDYQRPYKWDVEKCETLWNDIENFTNTEAVDGSDYFLGTIVSFKNEDQNQEIIDGQQRITSFLLLLRAFYRKLEAMKEDADVIGLKNQLAPCIWDINKISQKVSDMSKIRIESLVATEEDNEVFHEILRSGNAELDDKDPYSVNYRFFKKRCDEYAENHPMQWKQLCVTILHNCIILPIECDTTETALTIFSTLNDRGMPLADSDIFKARIYRNMATQVAKKEFTETWKVLTKKCKEAGIQIDDLFRYYSHVLRARNNDKTKEIGLRRFYTDNKTNRIADPFLLNEIMILADFWLNINTGDEGEEDEYIISVEARKYLHCLELYPNEFWKYATSVYFLKNQENEEFEEEFESFLKELTAFLFAKFIDQPSVNAIKDDIYSACISIENDGELDLSYKFKETYIGERLELYTFSKLTRPLLLLHAYLHPEQEDIIAPKFEIEHIFPKKWQMANYNGWSQDDAEDYLEMFGNKVIFEKKLNIQAGNGYFGQKKARYKDSKIAIVKELGEIKQNDWLQIDIEDRDEEFKNTILTFLKEQLG